MCGIAGFLGARGSAEPDGLLRGMTDAVAHRGPDDAGLWTDCDAGVALGHRRLSILDLSAEGHQPKTSASERWVVAFNGEIYNFRELRSELEQRGARFRGHSDTEVLLAGFEAWGLVATVRRAAGMFAMAVWDRETRTLHLVRDRLGEKPLYVGTFDGTLLFASELKAMRRHPAWRGEIDRDVLTAYLRVGYVPGPYAIYRNVRKVEPGTIVSVRAVDGRLEERTEAYWSVGDAFARGVSDPLTGSHDEMVTALEDVLRRTVRDEMVSDVPLGAFLSGGIDSSTIVALMQAESRRPVRTFTIGFHDPAFNEAEHARDVARHLGTEHTELYVTPDDLLDVVPLMPALYDEPFADPSQVPTYLVSRLARQHVTVALSGDGGDEMFGGYTRHLWAERAWRRIAPLPPLLRRGGAAIGGRVSPRVWNAAYAAGQRFLPAHARQRLPGDKLRKLTRLLAARDVDEVYGILLAQWDRPATALPGATIPLSWACLLYTSDAADEL